MRSSAPRALCALLTLCSLLLALPAEAQRLNRGLPGSARMTASVNRVAPASGGTAFDWSGVDAVIDPSVLSTLYQDAACATPVTASGQDVACVKHPATGATVFTVPSGGGAWRYQAGSGKPYLEPKASGTGADARLTYDPGATHTVAHTFVAYRLAGFPPDNNNGRLIAPVTSSEIMYLSTLTTGALDGYNGGGGSITTGPLALSTNAMVEFLVTNSGFSTPTWGRMIFNGASTGTFSSSAPGATSMRGMVLGGPSGPFAGGPANSRVYGLAYHRAQLSDTRSAEITTYLQSRLP